MKEENILLSLIILIIGVSIVVYEVASLKKQFDSSISRVGNDYYLDIHDPEFTTHDLDALVSSLKSKNISSIKGNFYIINKDRKSFIIVDI